MTTAGINAVSAGTEERPSVYRPLRSTSLLAQLGVLVVAETAIYLSYAAHDAGFHFAIHLLVGLTAAALWLAVFLVVAARPTRLQILSILGFHLWAMWPDLAFRYGVPHYAWMDWVALGHVTSHYLPGGDIGWLLIATTAAAGYLLLLSRWLAARAAEASAGLPAALDIAGAAVLRAQRDPRRQPLAHEHQGPALTGDSQPVLMLHGLGATSAVWDAAAADVARSRPVIVVDLLGFGSSVRLGTRFTLDDQAAAVLHLLDHHRVTRAHLLAHSWGCVVAAAVAKRAPHRVARLTLLNPAAFHDPDKAKARFERRSWLAKQTLSDTGAVRFVAGLMSLIRPVLIRLAPRMQPDVPERVAREGVQHIYPAYREAVRSMFSANPLNDLLRAPTHPTVVVLANQDETVHPSDVLDLPPSDDVLVLRVDGTHGLPYDDPDAVVEAVEIAPGAASVPLAAGEVRVDETAEGGLPGDAR